jgi:hypothetical protein
MIPSENVTPEHSEVSGIKPTNLPPRKEILNQACLEWVNRDSFGYLGRYTREEFLQDFEMRTGHYITIDEHKRALRDAEKRGLIKRKW